MSLSDNAQPLVQKRSGKSTGRRKNAIRALIVLSYLFSCILPAFPFGQFSATYLLYPFATATAFALGLSGIHDPGNYPLICGVVVFVLFFWMLIRPRWVIAVFLILYFLTGAFFMYTLGLIPAH